MSNWHVDRYSGHVYKDATQVEVIDKDGISINTTAKSLKFTRNKSTNNCRLTSYTHDLCNIAYGDMITIKDMQGNSTTGVVIDKEVNNYEGLKTLDLVIEGNIE